MRNRRLGRKIARTLSKRGYRRCTHEHCLVIRPGERFSMERGNGTLMFLENSGQTDLYIQFKPS